MRQFVQRLLQQPDSYLLMLQRYRQGQPKLSAMQLAHARREFEAVGRVFPLIEV